MQSPGHRDLIQAEILRKYPVPFHMGKTGIPNTVKRELLKLIPAVWKSGRLVSLCDISCSPDIGRSLSGGENERWFMEDLHLCKSVISNIVIIVTVLN
jgi:hypothetical protein